MTARILVVEDNPANMKLVSMVLAKGGHHVLQAEDAESGVALAADEQPDLILMDILLPGMDGLEATRRLKTDPLTARIRVVALTAFAMKEDELRIQSAGFDGYIAKPIQYKSFLQEVERWLSESAGPRGPAI